jgi:hypothetical protein
LTKTIRKSQDYDKVRLATGQDDGWLDAYICRACCSITTDMAQHDRSHLKQDDQVRAITDRVKELAKRVTEHSRDMVRVNSILGRLGRR